MSKRAKIAMLLLSVLALSALVLRSNPRIPLASSTILQKASSTGCYWIVAAQLALGVDPDGPDRTPLIEAIWNNHPNVAAVLVSHGAALERRFASGEPDGQPLAWALRFGRVEISKILIRHGANTDYEAEFGYGPLHQAAALGSDELVALLLRNGADPNKRDRLGVRPLHLAAAYGHLGIARALLRAGAGTAVRTGSVGSAHYLSTYYTEVQSRVILARATPLDIALARGDKPMIRLLSTR